MVDTMTASILPLPNACWKTLGREMNVRLAPTPMSSGVMPMLKTDGKIMKPAMMAMPVSIIATLTADFANGVLWSK